MDMTTAIALLAAQYAPLAEPEPPIVIRNAPKRETAKAKAAKANAKGEEKAPVVKGKTGPAIFGLSMPDKRPLSAESAAIFMSDIRSAGKRPNANGVLTFQPLMVRDDTVKAIAGFQGYNPTGNFGEQELAARAEAMRLLGIAKTNGATRSEERSALRSLQGFTAGAADHAAKRRATLDAQQVAIVEAIVGLEATGQDTLAAIERARLQQVRADLSYMDNGGSFIAPY